jgi:hypothetical protein
MFTYIYCMQIGGVKERPLSSRGDNAVDKERPLSSRGDNAVDKERHLFSRGDNAVDKEKPLSKGSSQNMTVFFKRS